MPRPEDVKPIKKTHHRGTEDTEKARKPEGRKARKLEDEKVKI